MKKLVKLFVCLLALVVMVTLVGCGKKNVYEEVKEKGVIVISTSPDYAPWEFIDSSKTGQDQYVGADVELMKYIAEKLGVKLEIKATDFDTTLALLQAGSVDLAISGFTYKDERAEQFEFSKAYDSEGSQGVIVLKEKVEEYKDLAAINKAGIKVAAQNGSLQADYVAEYLPNAEAKPVTKIVDGLTYLDSGEVAALAISSTAADSILANNSDKYVYLEDTFPVSELETQTFVLAQKGQEELIAEVNKIIDEVIEKGLYKEWMKDAEALAKEIGELE